MWWCCYWAWCCYFCVDNSPFLRMQHLLRLLSLLVNLGHKWWSELWLILANWNSKQKNRVNITMLNRFQVEFCYSSQTLISGTHVRSSQHSHFVLHSPPFFKTLVNFLSWSSQNLQRSYTSQLVPKCRGKHDMHVVEQDMTKNLVEWHDTVLGGRFKLIFRQWRAFRGFLPAPLYTFFNGKRLGLIDMVIWLCCWGGWCHQINYSPHDIWSLTSFSTLTLVCEDDWFDEHGGSILCSRRTEIWS